MIIILSILLSISIVFNVKFLFNKNTLKDKYSDLKLEIEELIHKDESNEKTISNLVKRLEATTEVIEEVVKPTTRLRKSKKES